MPTAKLIFGWPDLALSPNAKRSVAMYKKPKATADQRAEGFWLAKEAGLPDDPKPKLEFAFYPPKIRRRRDIHNMPVQMKAAIDGIADAMKVDDERFDCVWPRKFSDPEGRGRVEVLVTVTKDLRTRRKSS